MGVHGLWKLIEPTSKTVPLETMANKILAIDVSIWLHQAMKGMQDTKGAPLSCAHLLVLFHRLCKLLFYKIKPIFVFDGGVPALKRQTMAVRRNQKNVSKTEAVKVREKMLKNLLKHEAVRQLLSDQSASSAIGLSSLNLPGPSDEENLFKLPEIVEDVTSDDEYASSESEDGQLKSYQDIHAIDVTSKEFRSLPTQQRHDILTELIETRKQNSWRFLDTMPKDSNNFSDFQMKRLLQRHAVQTSLSQTEKEMGGRSMSLQEFELLLSEQGVIHEKLVGERRIAQDNVTRFLYIDKNVQMNKDDEDAKVLYEMLKELEEPRDVTESKEIKSELVKKNDDLSSSDEESLILQQQSSQEKEQNTSCERNNFGEEELNPKSRDKFDDISRKTNEGVGDLGREKETELEPQTKLDMAMEIDRESGCGEGELEQEIDKEIGLESQIDEDKELDEEVQAELKRSGEVVEIAVNENLEQSKKLEILNEKDSNKEVKIISPNESGSNKEVKIISPNESGSNKEVKIISPNESGSNKEVKIMSPNERDSNKEVKIISPNESGSNKEVGIELLEKSGSNREIQDEIQADVSGTMRQESECVILDNKSLDSDSDSDMVEISEMDSCGELVSEELEVDNARARPVEVTVALENVKSCDDIFADVFQPSGDVEEVRSVLEDEDVDKTGDVEEIRSVLEDEDVDKTGDVEEIRSVLEDEDVAAQQQVVDVPLTVDNLHDLQVDIIGKQNELINEQGKHERMAQSITDQMYTEAQELLRLFGVPFIVAPMEAEAQCAFLDMAGLSQGTITDDSDIWLFGGRTVYKNFFNQKKHVLEYKNDDIQKYFKLSRYEMIKLAMLVGSDYTPGLNGVGPVTALEVLAAFPSPPHPEKMLNCLTDFKKWFHSESLLGIYKKALKNKLKSTSLSPGFPDKAVIDAYLRPEVDESKEPFSWAKPNVNLLQDFAKRKFGWSTNKTNELLLPVMKKLLETSEQSSILKFIKTTSRCEPKEGMFSKRVEKAVKRLGRECNSEDEDDDDEDKPSTSKKVKSNKNVRVRRKQEPVTESSSKFDKALEEDVKRRLHKDLKIPQREVTKTLLSNRKQKAAEIFKTYNKSGPRSKKKVVMKPLEEANLSESSSDD